MEKTLSVCRENRLLKRLVSTTVAFVFTFFSVYTPGVSFAKVTNMPVANTAGMNTLHTNIHDIKISDHNGMIKETFQGTNGKLLVHIQDAHVNYEGQKSLSRILRSVIKEHGIDLVLVEGGWGDVGLSFLRYFSTKEKREEIADRYLKNGLIAGEEYLDIVSDPGFDLDIQGIEDKKLYNANLKQFLKIDKFSDKAVEFLGSVEGSLSILKDKFYSASLKTFDKKTAAYDAGEIDIADYAKYLDKIAQSTEYAGIQNLFKIERLEKAIDFDVVNTERDKFINKLTKALPKEDLKTLLDKSVEFKSGMLKASEYYPYVKELSEGTKIDIRKYHNLHVYTYYIKLFGELESESLFRELAALEKKAEAALCVDDTQRSIACISGKAALLKNLVNLSLTPDDFREYKENKKECDLKAS
jgi:hypothetical protein